MAIVRCKVVGRLPIVGADRKPVRQGGTVELDDTRVNVRALVAAGHVEPLPEPKPKPDKAKGDG